MKRKPFEKLLRELERLRKESEKKIDLAADGYDSGYYVGEESAFAAAIELLKGAINE